MVEIRDDCRREVAARGLTSTAVAHLARDALGTVELDNLAPVKTLLKRFFSPESWAPADDDALADLVGPGAGWWSHDLDEQCVFEYGWRAGRFQLELSPRADGLFDGPVVPEATPNPRTIRFVTPPIHDGPSRWYESVADADDPRVARLFEFADVANVLVGPAFVAIGLRRPDTWEQVLAPLLRVVTAEFAQTAPGSAPPNPAEPTVRDQDPDVRAPSEAHTGALDRAWTALGALRPDRPRDLERLVTAVSAADAAERQVAARLMIGAAADVGEIAWDRLLGDPSRGVRRATVDAMVDAQRPALRPLLERALSDGDAWTRWKALRGLVELGVEPSRGVVTTLSDDPDFRVRLETARALREPRD
ncbi:MAG TPA: HEAT repeat domain-containing protein [Acidimicrobiia bacterium]